LVASPVDGSQGDGIEAFRIKLRRLIVVAQDADFALLDDLVQALARVRAVPDHVAQAVNLGHTLPPDIVEHDPQCFQVRVDIADQSSFQSTKPP
jgi:hypothetical protein